jgi:serine/threonine-protein kinase
MGALVLAGALGFMLWQRGSADTAPTPAAAPAPVAPPAASLPAPVQTQALPGLPPSADMAAPATIDSSASAAATTTATTLPAAVAPALPADIAKPAAAAVKRGASAPKPAKESITERRAREVAAAVQTSLATGIVRVAISPWGEVEIDGKRAGTSPPLTELTLPTGRHQIVVRNTDLPPFTATIDVTADQPITFRHKF